MQDNSEETAAHFLRVAASFNWSVKRTSNSGLRPLLDAAYLRLGGKPSVAIVPN